MMYCIADKTPDNASNPEIKNTTPVSDVICPSCKNQISIIECKKSTITCVHCNATSKVRKLQPVVNDVNETSTKGQEMKSKSFNDVLCHTADKTPDNASNPEMKNSTPVSDVICPNCKNEISIIECKKSLFCLISLVCLLCLLSQFTQFTQFYFVGPVMRLLVIIGAAKVL